MRFADRILSALPLALAALVVGSAALAIVVSEPVAAGGGSIAVECYYRAGGVGETAAIEDPDTDTAGCEAEGRLVLAFLSTDDAGGTVAPTIGGNGVTVAQHDACYDPLFRVTSAVGSFSIGASETWGAGNKEFTWTGSETWALHVYVLSGQDATTPLGTFELNDHGGAVTDAVAPAITPAETAGLFYFISADGTNVGSFTTPGGVTCPDSDCFATQGGGTGVTAGTWYELDAASAVSRTWTDWLTIADEICASVQAVYP